MPSPSETFHPAVSAADRLSKIASFGHSGRQAPHEIHSSVILTDIRVPPLSHSPRPRARPALSKPFHADPPDDQRDAGPFDRRAQCQDTRVSGWVNLATINTASQS